MNLNIKLLIVIQLKSYLFNSFEISYLMIMYVQHII